MIKRNKDIISIKQYLDIFPVVAILGARQCGKTTIALQFRSEYLFDLENPSDLSRLSDPLLTLESLKGLVIIDEVQKEPGIFPVLRTLVDRKPDTQYLLLGSASRELVNRTSESLAGRIGYYHLGGFRIEDVEKEHWHKLWVRGGYPRSFTLDSDNKSQIWRNNYISTFLERDIPQLGIRIPARTLRKFWIMLSHYHGQLLNYSELARSFGISDMTVRKYIDILSNTFMVRVLQPWHNNTSKRLVKSPKLYIRDSGIFHSLQSISNMKSLETHPKLGASWEGFALDQLCMALGLRDEECFFWGSHGGAELDLFWQSDGNNMGAEFKYTSSPEITRSMHSAMEDLHLEHLLVIYPGTKRYSLSKKITALPVMDIKSGIIKSHFSK